MKRETALSALEKGKTVDSLDLYKIVEASEEIPLLDKPKIAYVLSVGKERVYGLLSKGGIVYGGNILPPTEYQLKQPLQERLQEEKIIYLIGSQNEDLKIRDRQIILSSESPFGPTEGVVLVSPNLVSHITFLPDENHKMSKPGFVRKIQVEGAQDSVCWELGKALSNVFTSLFKEQGLYTEKLAQSTPIHPAVCVNATLLEIGMHGGRVEPPYLRRNAGQ